MAVLAASAARLGAPRGPSRSSPAEVQLGALHGLGGGAQGDAGAGRATNGTGIGTGIGNGIGMSSAICLGSEAISGTGSNVATPSKSAALIWRAHFGPAWCMPRRSLSMMPPAGRSCTGRVHSSVLTYKASSAQSTPEARARGSALAPRARMSTWSTTTGR